MSVTLTDDQWNPIDEELFSGGRIRALVMLRAITDLSIHDGAYLLEDRVSFLSKSSPQRFTVSTSGYWDDFYLS
ncbi:hypothetical protein [Haloferula sp. BvORR071]|uniref:hypothetical protein n=1 Tax=Haloferula sp. BvORR071 TaxID=1396141 RepID=UPI000554762E|nr:hypothetical protein [Haloferula sp. BvORR071]